MAAQVQGSGEGPCGALQGADNSQIQLLTLQAWWKRHCKVFSTWWLITATAEEKLAILRNAAPDMPQINAATRSKDTTNALRVTDLLLPELSEDALTGVGGKLLVLLLTRRLSPHDLGFSSDMVFLKALREAGKLPLFDSGALSEYEDPFVDPMDPQEKIVVLPRCSNEEDREAQKQALLRDFDCNNLVRADVWLAFRLRRDKISDFMLHLVLEVEERVAKIAASKSEPSDICPDYKSLYAAEIKMQEFLDGEAGVDAARVGTAQDP